MSATYSNTIITQQDAKDSTPIPVPANPPAIAVVERVIVTRRAQIMTDVVKQINTLLIAAVSTVATRQLTADVPVGNGHQVKITSVAKHASTNASMGPDVGRCWCCYQITLPEYTRYDECSNCKECICLLACCSCRNSRDMHVKAQTKQRVICMLPIVDEVDAAFVQELSGHYARSQYETRSWKQGWWWTPTVYCLEIAVPVATPAAATIAAMHRGGPVYEPTVVEIHPQSM